ncbi:hypothetical protein Pmani_021211 [Petrolisthes manimaculis]|uniref:DNA-directed primase/polymerase protein n=1 Tax=Petrolisthes manimaculis TaxID=1843537 RepID=A0AAE1PGT0_9EUCA|nr:hypothetical protein Pmani_021211 [Petrolisthes manimaculis]
MEHTRVTSESLSSLSTQGFYGRQRTSAGGGDQRWQRLNHVEEGVRHMELHPPPRVFHSRLLGPSATWRVFPRQAQALEYAQTQGHGLMVFAFEGEAVGSGGCRQFMTTHPRQMWQRQTERQPHQRCSYEVIQEGAVCKLYFDLEFPRAHNPCNNGSTMIDTFIAVVCHFIHQEFNLRCSRKNILELCSSTDAKFSKHLIFNIPNTAFADNIQVGNFVSMVCKKLEEFDEGRALVNIPGIELQDIEQLFVLDFKKCRILFCDKGVYTKNRNFRLYLSTKLGKQTPLVVAKDNQYSPTLHPGTGVEEQIFLDSLITLVDDNCTILTYGEAVLKAKKIKRDNNSGSLPLELDGRGLSPYPEVDRFIDQVVSPGYIRIWYYFSHGALIVYEIAQHRYCYNIGRHHRSNGIMYVVDLKTETYYQKCHDPDCRGFKSPPKRLPDDVAFWRSLSHEMDIGNPIKDDEVSLMIEAERLSGISDQKLMDAAEIVENWQSLDQSSCSSSIILSSLQDSQTSSQFSSLKSSYSINSNPWENLSQVSTPSPSFFQNLSQRFISQEFSQNSEVHMNFLSQTRAELSEFSEDTNGDDELLAAVADVEKRGDWEVEWIR